MHGCWNPLVIIKLVSLGIDMFDTSYLYIVGERKSALTFSYDPISKTDKNDYEINFLNSK